MPRSLAVDEYKLEWASPSEDDVDWQSIPEAVSLFDRWDEQERDRREIQKQIQREKARKARREWWLRVCVGWPVLVIGGALFFVLISGFLLACLILVFTTGGGRPPWAP